MAITQNNVQNVKFLRNQDVNITRDAAISLLNEHKGDAADGTALLARYTVSGTVKTIVGFVYVTGEKHDITIFDTEGASGDVEKLRQEINAKLGSGITSANTATAQLEALSGTSADTSATTSVEGAKRYAEDLISTLDGGVTAETGYYVDSVSEVDGKISGTTKALPSVEAISEPGKAIIAVSESNGTISATAGTIDAQYVNIADSGDKFTATTVEGALAELDDKINSTVDGLDYTGVTTGTGVYVTNVTEENGKISATTATLPTVNDTAVAKKFVTAVDETLGEISIERGSITSVDKTVVLGDANDGGVDFSVHIDNDTLQKDENGVISVTSSALVQYEGDTKTIAISPVENGVRTVSTLLTLSSVTPSSTTVKEEYALKNASGETIGSTIKIYKDSSLVSIELVNEDPTQDPPKAGQFLKYTYIDASGATQSVYVDVSALLVEAEFESGVTANAAGVVHGVVDPTSEKDSNNDSFLTVGANGFKIDGIKDEIDKKLGDIVGDLDANVTAATSGNHVTITIDEVDGKLTQSGLTIEENDIASAAALAGLSAKTITNVTSTNGSIDIATANTSDDTVEVNVITDASKIKMSGFTADESGFTAITEGTSVKDAVKVVESAFTEAERVTAAALADLDGRLDVIESGYVETVKVNDIALAETNNAVNVQITASSSAMTGSNAVVINTDNSTGAITLGLGTIDCGYYS